MAKLAEPIGDGNVAFIRITPCSGTLPVGVGDLEASQILQLVRPHGHAESAHRLIDLVGKASVEQHVIGLTAIGLEHAIADKAVANS